MQYFYIKQNSTLPRIQMELIEDGRHDFHKFHECIQAADITFTMTNIDNAMTGRNETRKRLEVIRVCLKSLLAVILKMIHILILMVY